ncbi:hypothetical protein I601_1606 [Nocardioides dokdonensis FR1436]|uniref:Uncharacterized protein n=1 Tax=Nocardioides dokdonensis FR1436 TaxID=1300347 RepID=A0A1A9GID5_9ACTN|nr:hypothetical protein I601_1606 [Nocardioides dokdonensis FR1436]
MGGRLTFVSDLLWPGDERAGATDAPAEETLAQPRCAEGPATGRTP